MRKGLIVASMAALGLAGTALADNGFDYSYIELGYVSTELDDSNVDGDGFELRGSLEVTRNIHVFVTYNDLDFDSNVDTRTFEVGGGYAWPVRSNLDIIASVSYLRTEVDPPNARDFDDDGIGLALGLRGRASDQIELTAALKHVDYDDWGDDTAFTVGGRYFFTKAFALGLDVTFDDDTTSWYLGGRWSFGK
jgi:hypothetical protein